jgi:hypothetical protein
VTAIFLAALMLGASAAESASEQRPEPPTIEIPTLMGEHGGPDDRRVRLMSGSCERAGDDATMRCVLTITMIVAQPDGRCEVVMHPFQPEAFRLVGGKSAGRGNEWVSKEETGYCRRTRTSTLRLDGTASRLTIRGPVEESADCTDEPRFLQGVWTSEGSVTLDPPCSVMELRF